MTQPREPREYAPRPEPGPLERVLVAREKRERPALKAQALAAQNRDVREFTYNGLTIRLRNAPAFREIVIEGRRSPVLWVEVAEVLRPDGTPIELRQPEKQPDGSVKLVPHDGLFPVGNPAIKVPDGTWRMETIEGEERDVENMREDLTAAFVEMVGQAVESVARKWGR